MATQVKVYPPYGSPHMVSRMISAGVNKYHFKLYLLTADGTDKSIAEWNPYKAKFDIDRQLPLRFDRDTSIAHGALVNRDFGFTVVDWCDGPNHPSQLADYDCGTGIWTDCYPSATNSPNISDESFVCFDQDRDRMVVVWPEIASAKMKLAWLDLATYAWVSPDLPAEPDARFDCRCDILGNYLVLTGGISFTEDGEERFHSLKRLDVFFIREQRWINLGAGLERTERVPVKRRQHVFLADTRGLCFYLLGGERRAKLPHYPYGPNLALRDIYKLEIRESPPPSTALRQVCRPGLVTTVSAGGEVSQKMITPTWIKVNGTLDANVGVDAVAAVHHSHNNSGVSTHLWLFGSEIPGRAWLRFHSMTCVDLGIPSALWKLCLNSMRENGYFEDSDSEQEQLDKVPLGMKEKLTSITYKRARRDSDSQKENVDPTN